MMCRAIVRGDYSQLSLLLEAGFDASGEYLENGSPLHVAALHGQLQAARLLLSRGRADPAKCTRSGLTPLDIAAKQGNGPMVTLLQRAAARLAGANDNSAKANATAAPPQPSQGVPGISAAMGEPSFALSDDMTGLSTPLATAEEDGGKPSPLQARAGAPKAETEMEEMGKEVPCADAFGDARPPGPSTAVAAELSAAEQRGDLPHGPAPSKGNETKDTSL
mmetsp:Transcript_6133/g.17118  ORF Transcript_6133/g.17118 Transcript_6133/m.17118 type:complete len:221 (-) Transcript_6133:162-824(-)